MKLASVSLAALAALPAVLPAQAYPKSPPPAAPVRPAQFPPFQEAALANGMRLVVVQNTKQPVVSISLSVPAGAVYDPAGKEGVADMVAGLLTKGAGNRTAEQIAETIEGVGGSIAASAGLDNLTVGADVLAPNAQLAFDLVADAMVRPTFPDKEIDLLRTQTLSGLQLELSQPANLASRFFAQSLYGSNPYGRRPTPATVRALTRNDLTAFQQARLRPAGALLVVAGDIALADARRMADQAFAGWTGSPAATPAVPAPPARKPTEILLVHRPGSVQSNIVIGNTSFLPADPRYYASVVANRVLGGAASARLFRVLREQKGWTYGAYSDLRRPKGLGAFQANAEVRTEVTDSSLTEMLAQLRRIRTEPVPAVELDQAKSALVGSFPLSIETAGQVAAAVANAKLLGLPDDYLRQYRTRLSAVTAAQLRDAASTVVRPDSSVIVVVGDATKIREQLARIAPVRMVDVEGKPLTPADLGGRPTALDLDLSKLVPRRDSFVVLVQGNPLGWQRTTLEKTADGFRYLEQTEIAAAGLQQNGEVTFDASGRMRQVKQSGKVGGQEMKIDVVYANGRAKGSATTPTPQGTPKSVTIDTAIAPGVIDDQAIQALMPAIRWAPNAKFPVAVFGSGSGEFKQVTLNVVGTESVTVPAGTFEVYRVDVTGGQQPATFFITTAAPHRVVKIETAGGQIQIALAK